MAVVFIDEGVSKAEMEGNLVRPQTAVNKR